MVIVRGIYPDSCPAVPVHSFLAGHPHRHKPLASLEDLRTAYEADPESLSEEDTRRMIRLWNRKRIRDRNEATKKR